MSGSGRAVTDPVDGPVTGPADATVADTGDRHAEFERKYYVHFPGVMTLAEFARTVDELNRW